MIEGAADRRDDPPAALLQWASESVGAAMAPTVTSMSQGGAGGPWRLDWGAGDRHLSLALKAEHPGPEERRRFATAAAALDLAATHDVPAPRPVAHDLTGACGWVASLTTLLPGRSSIAAHIPPGRLRALGGAVARIHRVSGLPTPDLPLRSRSLEGYDLDAAAPSTDSATLLAHAREALADGTTIDEPLGFVHGDFWQGNTLWDGERYAGAVDWDFAGFGPAGIDLGSLRADVAVLHGLEAAAHVLAGWEEVAGRAARHLDWWDVVAGASTPEDMGGWLPNFQAQGRTDLDLETITRRRDAFLEQALADLR
jgi:aminoglycoside phosphotransferase (APT) family kinase protein